MKSYFVNPNKQANGDNEVHEQGCYWLSLVTNPVFVGNHYSCVTAVQNARNMGYNANGCKHCSPACHTR